MAVLGRLARLEDARALVARDLQVARDALLRRRLDHRRDVDAEALRLVDEQRLDGAVQALEQRVGDRARARARGAAALHFWPAKPKAE